MKQVMELHSSAVMSWRGVSVRGAIKTLTTGMIGFEGFSEGFSSSCEGYVLVLPLLASTYLSVGRILSFGRKQTSAPVRY